MLLSNKYKDLIHKCICIHLKKVKSLWKVANSLGNHPTFYFSAVKSHSVTHSSFFRKQSAKLL